MPDSDELSEKNQPPVTIPQIVLTEPPSQPNDSNEEQEELKLTPLSNNNSSSTSSSPISLPKPSVNTTPLPLTKDILQRKNKLDKLLIQKEKLQQQQQQQQQHQHHSAEYFSSNPVDERVTAGLGISTPNDRLSSSAGLRSRRTSTTRYNRSETEKAFPEWTYNDLDTFKSVTSDSSKGGRRNDKRKTTVTQSGATSQSGSSNRNSMRAYSANHRYMDRQHEKAVQSHYERPRQFDGINQFGSENKSKYHLVDLLIQAVIRVVNSRAPESKFIKSKELFNFHPVAIETTKTTASSSSHIPIHITTTTSQQQHETTTNEKVDLIAPPHTPTSNNSNRNSHRFSWLSHSNHSMEDGKSFFDENESVYFEKKLSSHLETPIIPPPLKPISISEDLLPNPLQGNSLYLFSPNNPIRILIWQWIRNRYVETAIFFLMIIHWFLLACVPITSNEQKSVFGGQWSHYPILIIQCIYTVEMLCKVVAYGLLFPPSSATNSKTTPRFYQYAHWRFPRLFQSFGSTSPTINEEPITAATAAGTATGATQTAAGMSKSSTFVVDEIDLKFTRNHRAYLNSFGNVVDLISIVSYWADFVLMMVEYPNLSLFKSLGALRPIRLLSLLPGTAVILKSLETSWDILLAVSGLIFFFLLLFALLGLISFQGVFSRRCYVTNVDTNSFQLVQPAQFCSGYMNGTTITGAYNLESGETSYPGYHGNICPFGQICIEDPNNNPEFGFVNFDNIFFSFLNVFTFVSLELWTDLMYQTQDADSTVAALYYCLGVYIIAFVLTFLLFAVITSAFARVRAVSAVSAFTAKKKGYPVLRDAEGLDDEAMWMFENTPEELGRGVTRLKLRWWIVRLVKSRFFFYFGGFLVLFDLVFMCLRSFYASEKTLEMIDNAETAFTFVFAIEIILRIVGTTHWMTFWSTKRNLFDLFLVISTCVIQLPMIQDSWVYKYLTIFQILRLYRLFICIPRVRRLLSAALGTGESVIYVMVFLVLATALCSTIFMQMFGGDYDDVLDITDPENRFDTFWQSFVSLIVVYTSEMWTNVLYNAMESQTGQGSIYAGIALSLYFAFGRYIMSGLYIAVVLENFELSDEYIRHYQIKDFIHRHRFKDNDRTETILLKLFKPFYRFNENKSVQIDKLPTNLTVPLTKADLTELLSDLPKSKTRTLDDDELREPSLLERKIAVLYAKIRQKVPFLRKKTSIKAAPINPLIADVNDEPEDFEMIVAEENREARKENTPTVKSLFIFSNRSRIRYWCKRLVGSSNDGQAERRNLFNWIVMACVLVSIIMVILDEPSTRLIRKDTSKQDVFDTIEISLSIVFIVELLIRIIADGLLLTPNAYLRNHWNQLDICVILLNITTIFMGTDEAPRGLSTFRSLRILRLIRYFNGVRDIFVALFYALPLMLDALIFTFLVLVPFAVYGVNIFGGLMWMCNDETVMTRGECIGEFSYNFSSDDDVEALAWIPRVWQNPQNGFISYDTFPDALQQLFSLTSTEGWVDTMFSAMSTPRDPDTQPHFTWDSPTVYHGLFYLVFMIISQGTMQLFVGVIIEKFKERNGITTLTTAQRQYSDLQRLLAAVKPTIKVFRPQSRIRRWCHDMVIKKHGKFNRLMMCVIGLNIITIASEFNSAPEWLELAQDYAYMAFTVIYVIECIIKLLGLGWKKWIRSKWNWFDCIIATSALILLILRFASPDLWTLRVERYCLVLAAFRLGEGIDALQTLYHTIAKSTPAIIQVSAVFMVAMCLFAMLFMEFFGLTKYGIYGTAHSNFRDYGNALLLLVRATTGEAWNAILIDYTVQYPNCNRSSNYLEDDCGSQFWAYFLFDVFYIICTHIFMNLFTAVIISKFEYAYETRTRFTNITKADLRAFKHAWADIDTRGTGYIQKEDIAKLLRNLTGRFKFRIYDDAFSVSNIIRAGRKPKGTEKAAIASATASPKSPSGYQPSPQSNYKNNYNGDDSDINVNAINRLLSKMNLSEAQKRRMEYNIYYNEILRTETSKGIPFASVLTIISYRFINISTSLTLDPLIARLEKIEQLTQEYHLEKAAGFFLTQVQKKRFIRALWKKRDEDEVKKLGVTNASHFEFGSPNVDHSTNYLNMPRDKKKRNSPPVPRIVIDNVSTGALPTAQSSPATTTPGTAPVSPMSNFSLDNMYDPTYSGGGYSLSVAPGTSSIPSSPNTDFDGTGRLGGGALSPYSPIPNLSPASRQNWLLIDGNVEMPMDVSDGLMDSMNHNIWSDMLRDEDNL